MGDGVVDTVKDNALDVARGGVSLIAKDSKVAQIAQGGLFGRGGVFDQTADSFAVMFGVSKTIVIFAAVAYGLHVISKRKRR